MTQPSDRVTQALVVHAHHEPNSFSSAMFQRTVRTLAEAGYKVEVSDLYRMGWNPVSDRRNFRSVLNPAYLKQQAEERHAAASGGFADEIEAELAKLENCDLLIFSFPLWWYGMPAILKGWVDRVFAMGRVYGGARKFERGLGQGRKRALIVMTTGGDAASFNGYGMNPSLESVLRPIEHGIFWFNGFLPLEPHVAWSPARLTPQARQDCLDKLQARLHRLHEESPRSFPLQSEFTPEGIDQKTRFMVRVRGSGPVETRIGLTDASWRYLRELQRDGVLLADHWSDSDGECWNGFLLFRAWTLEDVQGYLAALPSSRFCSFEITALAQRTAAFSGQPNGSLVPKHS